MITFRTNHLLILAGDVLPELVGKMYGYPIKEYLLDVGTWPNYEEAQEKWRK